MSKKIMIFLIIFTAVSISTTATLINIANKSDNLQIEEKTINGTYHRLKEGINLKGYYNQNDLEINEVQKVHSFVTEDGLEMQEYTIPQISGLKNKEIEEKINTDIATKISMELDTMSNLESNYIRKSGNFSNILSLGFTIYSSDNDRGGTLTFNYDLTTGDEIVFEDLFTEDADIEKILRSEIADLLITERYYGNLRDHYENDDNEEDETLEWKIPENLNPREEAVYKFTKSLIKQKNKKFLISPTFLEVFIGQDDILIFYNDTPEQFTVYTRYDISESIFENSNIGIKNIPNCTERYYDNEHTLAYGFLTENLWCDFTLTDYTDIKDLTDEQSYKYQEFTDYIKESMKREINNLKLKALQNPSKLFVIRNAYNLSLYFRTRYDETSKLVRIYSNLATLLKDETKYEINNEDAKKDFDAIITNIYQDTQKWYGEDYENIFEDIDDSEVEVEKTHKQYVYNFRTKSELKVEDIFKSGVNVREILKNSLGIILSESDYDLTEEEIEEYKKEAKYQLFANTIYVDGEEFESYIPYEMLLDYLNIMD